MRIKELTRRELLKAGLVTAGAAVLGPAVVKPTGAWAASPKIKGPIKVGYQAVMSGTLAGYGDFHKMGATMAMEEINAAGGIAGNKLEIEFRDSTLKADEAIKNARYFADSWEADFLAGVDSSGQALALAPVMAELDRVLMVTHAATEKLTEQQVFKNGIKQMFSHLHAHLPGRQCGRLRGQGPAGQDLGHDKPQVRVWLHLLGHVQRHAGQAEVRCFLCCRFLGAVRHHRLSSAHQHHHGCRTRRFLFC